MSSQTYQVLLRHCPRTASQTLTPSASPHVASRRQSPLQPPCVNHRRCDVSTGSDAPFHACQGCRHRHSGFHVWHRGSKKPPRRLAVSRLSCRCCCRGFFAVACNGNATFPAATATNKALSLQEKGTCAVLLSRLLRNFFWTRFYFLNTLGRLFALSLQLWKPPVLVNSAQAATSKLLPSELRRHNSRRADFPTSLRIRPLSRYLSLVEKIPTNFALLFDLLLPFSLPFLSFAISYSETTCFGCASCAWRCQGRGRARLLLLQARGETLVYF